MPTELGTKHTAMNTSDGASTTCIEVSRPPEGGRVMTRFSVSAPPNRPAMRPMLLSSDDARARISLVPDGALLLAGDDIVIEIAVGPGAHLELVEPAGTVAYSMDGGSATWRVAIDLAPTSSLVWAGEPFVVAEGARVKRGTSIRLGWDARLAMREIVVLGRHGEGPGVLEQQLTAVAENGVPILTEHLSVGPESGPLLLGGSRVMGSVLALGARLDGGVADPRVTVLDLEAEGTLMRALVDDAHEAVHGWAEARRAVGRYAVDEICSRTLNSTSSAAAM
jgi:urease accessory protein